MNPEDVTIENMKQMQQQKQQGLENVTKDLKQLKRVNNDIKEELNKGDEIMDELKDNINGANQKVVAVKNKTGAFRDYLKRNAVPFPLTLIILVITVVVWSSQAFC